MLAFYCTCISDAIAIHAHYLDILDHSKISFLLSLLLFYQYVNELLCLLFSLQVKVGGLPSSPVVRRIQCESKSVSGCPFPVARFKPFPLTASIPFQTFNSGVYSTSNSPFPFIPGLASLRSLLKLGRPGLLRSLRSYSDRCGEYRSRTDDLLNANQAL